MEMALDWDVRTIQGQERWLHRLWGLYYNYFNYHLLKKAIRSYFYNSCPYFDAGGENRGAFGYRGGHNA